MKAATARSGVSLTSDWVCFGKCHHCPLQTDMYWLVMDIFAPSKWTNNIYPNFLFWFLEQYIIEDMILADIRCRKLLKNNWYEHQELVHAFGIHVKGTGLHVIDSCVPGEHRHTALLWAHLHVISTVLYSAPGNICLWYILVHRWARPCPRTAWLSMPTASHSYPSAGIRMLLSPSLLTLGQ